MSFPNGFQDSMRESEPSRAQGFLANVHLDFPTLAGLALLALAGLTVLYSATDQNLGQVNRQVVRLAVGFAVMAILAQIHPRHLRRWAPWLFFAGIGLLVAVLVFGQTGKGAQRWLDLMLFRFQPSEMMKLAVPMAVAWYLAEKPLPPTGGRLLIGSLFILIPAMLIAKQPDLGTALLIACSGAFVLFLAGTSWKLILGLVAALSALTPALWFLMHDYQRNRVLTFLNPESDPLGAGWNIIQSKIAVGSGGIYGKGWLNGTQSHLEFLPERTTDFIFAVLAEEFGLTGILLMLALYIFIVFRGLYIASRAQDTFSRLTAGSLILTFGVYVVVNTGMVTGLLPVVGVPLPLISYGGTSLVTLLAGFGILMSIHTHRKLLPT